AEPGPEQALIRVRTAALNFPDVLMTQGKYQFSPPMPFIPGLEASGEVVAVGKAVTTVSVGDKVVTSTRYGAISQYMLADQTDVRPAPARLSWPEAAAYQAASLTAYVALVNRGWLSKGETLLVHGASGGACACCRQAVLSANLS
ncbi:MAG: alcohol dehydrogenase catalytic domain-containing protein, partial [Burkholderiaceae bacterium]